MGSSRLRSVALVGSLWCFAGPSAHAAPGDFVRHSASATGHLATDSSQVLPAWTPSASVATTYLRSFAPTRSSRSSVEARLQANAAFALGIAGWGQLELALPTALHQRGLTYEDGRFVSLPGAAVGDLRIGARGTLLRTPRRGFGLGLSFDATAPSGQEAALTSYGGTTFTPGVLGEYRGPLGMVVAANLGYAVRPEVNLGTSIGGDALPYRLAVRVPVAPAEAFALFAELDAEASMVRGGRSPLALRGGFRWQTRGGLVMNLWGGGGVMTTVGLPTMQVGLSAGFIPASRMRSETAFEGAPRSGVIAVTRAHDRDLRAALDAPTPKPPTHPSDPDGDGVLARADRCPNVAEDADGYEDEDGCPELDDDHDGIRDLVDLCPSAPEIVNGYRDLDGCPDRKLAHGGQTFETFDPRQVLPALHFASGSAQIDATMDAQLDEVAELLVLNPWIERLQLGVFVPRTDDEAADRRLAEARTRALRTALDVRGVSRWRVEALPAKAVPAGTTERVRLTFSGRADALAPVAPRPDTLERIIAETRDEGGPPPETLEAQGPEAQSTGPR